MKQRFKKPIYDHQIVKIKHHGKNRATIYYADDPTSSTKDLHRYEVKVGMFERMVLGITLNYKLTFQVGKLQRTLRLRKLKKEWMKNGNETITRTSSESR